MILCCGEALIDMIPVSTISSEQAFAPRAGGAVFNTAIALGRLGVETGMLTGLSTDLFGQMLCERLSMSNVNSSHVIFTDRPTTLAFVELNKGQANYFFYDENSAGRMLLPHDIPPISSDVSVLYCGGISLAGESSGEAYTRLLEREGKGRAVMLDPNIRAGFIEDAATYRRRLERIIRIADIVKVSDDDLGWIDETRRSLHDKALGLLSKGVSLVILTEGENGATGFLSSGENVKVPINKVDVVDTVGAGDTFNAGVLAKLSEFEVLNKKYLRSLTPQIVKQALCYGTMVAGKTVSRSGANPPWADELNSVTRKTSDPDHVR